jgi:hypothetical protein
MLKSMYAERDLQELWARQAFRRDGLLTEDARRVVVEFPGLPSLEGGPDFRGARLEIGGLRVTGDVEIHLTPSGWRAHGHDRDGAYAGVVLHVVLRRDAFVAPPRTGLPLLVLEPHLHAAAAPSRVEADGDLDALGEAWFAERRARLLRQLERRGADELLYREILVALGYRHNQAGMAELSRRCPLGSLPDGAGAAEARLRSAAEGLPRGTWRLRSARPANHPWRRLAGMARFLAAARGEGLAGGLAARPGLEEQVAWLDPDGSGLIGRGRALEVALNVFTPFLGEEAWRRVAGLPAPAAPGALARSVGVRADTVRRRFGALRLLKRQEFSLAPLRGGC